jgi:hypothetical protein
MKCMLDDIGHLFASVYAMVSVSLCTLYHTMKTTFVFLSVISYYSFSPAVSISGNEDIFQFQDQDL